MRSRIIFAISSLFMLVLLIGCRTISAMLGIVPTCTNGAAPVIIEKDFEIPGTLIIFDTSHSTILAYDGKKHEFAPLIDVSGFENFNVSLVSSDGKWLLISQPKLSDLKSTEILLLSNIGQIERKVFLVPQSDDNTIRYSNWINDRSFFGYIQKNGSQEYGVFDPFVPQWRPIELSSLALYAGSGIALSPDLSRALFVDSEFHLVLYDLQNNKKLWKDPEYDGINPIMQSTVLIPSTWSEDGSLLAIPTSRRIDRTEEHGILLFDKNGNILKSSYFENRPFGLNFSHSKKYISFYEYRLFPSAVNGDAIPVVRLFDTETAKVSDLCVMDNDTEPIHNIKAGKILWSPDDAYVAYNYGDAPPQKNIKNGIIIQKLDSDQIRLIPAEDHNLILLGWSPYQWTR